MIAAGLGLLLEGPYHLDAAGFGTTEDPDHDGLVNVQEQVLGTDSQKPDTDGDGFSDLEELARGSHPNLGADQPGNGPVGVGMFARVEDEVVTVASAIYVADGPFSAANYRFGVVFEGRIIQVPVAAYMRATKVELFSAEGGGKLALLETSFPARIVRNLGHISTFATVEGPSGQPVVDTANLIEVGGVVMNVQTSAGVAGAPAGGLIYEPLVPDDEAPGGSTSKGQVCYQTTRTVGMNGASTVQEVESAGCEPLGGFCASAECSDSVGTTIEIVDPASLLGG